MSHTRTHIVAVLAGLVLATGTASADKADALFKKGKRLLADKKYAAACEAFVGVDELDPGIGAKLNAAKCFEEWGKLGTAYRWYRDAEKMAITSKDERATQIKQLLEDVDFNVPRVTVKIPKGADPDVIATITLDGAPFPASKLGVEQRVDPGPHLVEFMVAGEKRRKMAPVERGGSSEVTLDIPLGAGKRRGDAVRGGDGEDDDDAIARPGRTQRLLGLTLAAGGVVAVGVAGGLTLAARGDYNDALDTHCLGSPTMCSPEGLALTRDARSTANVATIITIAGGAMVIGGVVLYVLAPRAAADERRALYLTPVIGAEGGGLVFGGRY